MSVAACSPPSSSWERRLLELLQKRRRTFRAAPRTRARHARYGRSSKHVDQGDPFDFLAEAAGRGLLDETGVAATDGLKSLLSYRGGAPPSLEGHWARPNALSTIGATEHGEPQL